MRKIICALIAVGMALMLTACGKERSVKIENGAAVIAEPGLKVTLPQGWVVFDTEESMHRGGKVFLDFFGYNADYVKFDVVERLYPQFLLYAERPDGGIALSLRTGELSGDWDVYDFARDMNITVMEFYKEGGFDVRGALEPIPKDEFTGIRGFVSEVSIKKSERDAEQTVVFTDYIFTYKDDMFYMEIYAEESAYNDGKNIQILPAEL